MAVMDVVRVILSVSDLTQQGMQATFEHQEVGARQENRKTKSETAWVGGYVGLVRALRMAVRTAHLNVVMPLEEASESKFLDAIMDRARGTNNGRAGVA